MAPITTEVIGDPTSRFAIGKKTLWKSFFKLATLVATKRKQFKLCSSLENTVVISPPQNPELDSAARN